VRTLDDAIGLRAALVAGAKVVILGAGFIGCEVAATARKLGCDVTIVAPGVHPIARPLGVELAKEIQRRHEAEGVRFVMKTTVADLVGESHVEGVLLDSGEELQCDVFIEAIGSHANTEWLEGCDVDISDGILTDNAMRALRLDGTSHDNFFAIGDVARFANPIFDDVARRVEHWNIPTDTGKRVGQVLAAQLTGSENWPVVLEEKFAPIPSFWSDQFEMHILAFGLLALADETKLIHGEIGGDCVFGYYRDGQMIGVCGIGMRSTVQGYRAQVGKQ
jgi:NADPH-dependent 2,4-dienoyl-CoA reductase/sulfur reductase-like enzyme